MNTASLTCFQPAKRKPATITFDVEVTDTFGGEANYCWVRRYTIELPEDASDRAIMRAAKRIAGYAGVRGKTYNFGDVFEFRPYGLLQVMFVAVRY